MGDKMQRRIDGLGRIVIPKEIRKVLKLEEGDYVNIAIEQQAIKLTKDDEQQLQKEINTIIAMMQAHYGTKILFLSNKQKPMICNHFYDLMKCFKIKSFEHERIYKDDLCEYQGLIYPLIDKQEWIGSFILLNKSMNTNVMVLSYLCELLKQK